MSSISYRTFLSALALGFVFAFPALAGSISISEQVAHIEGDDEHGKHLAIFMIVENSGAADRIYAVRSKVAKTGRMSGGLAERSTGGHQKHLVATVIDVSANGRTELTDDTRHVELVDLKKNIEDGDTVQITLFFEKAGRIKIDVPVVAGDHD